MNEPEIFDFWSRQNAVGQSSGDREWNFGFIKLPGCLVNPANFFLS